MVITTRSLLGVVLLLAAAVTHAATPAWDEEFVGPFPTWYDLKKDFGAVGDGKADDTAALQKALDSVGTPELGRSAVWVPAGTYRITRTLVRTGVAGLWLIGEHPDTSIIRWDGPAYAGEARVPPFNSEAWKAWDGRHPAEMLWFNGRNSRFERLTFDGAGKAASGFAFKWHAIQAPGQTPSHRISLTDVVFKDMAIGFDGGGKALGLDSEVLLERCRFLRCSQFGVGLHHFNAVDYWLWHCTFEDCGVGVSNEPLPHGGVVHVYESTFRNSKEADFTIFHAGFFGLRHNYSQGSRRFVHAKNNGANGAQLHLQHNVVTEPLEPDAVLLETLGNVLLTDNAFNSRPGAVGPVVRAGIALSAAPAWEAENNAPAYPDGWAPVGVSAIGNTFTVEKPFVVKGQLIELDTRRITPGNYFWPVTPPERSGAAARHTRRVFEVAAGADAAALQQAIDDAAELAAAQPDAWPVVHLPQGRYELRKTVVVPAGARIQLVGDGCYQWGDGPKGTLLVWADEQATGPALLLKGPAKARLRDFGVTTPEPWRRTDEKLRTAAPAGLPAPPQPNLTAAIVAENVDQDGGRVHLRECNLNALFGTGVLVDGLDRTFVQAIAAEGVGADSWNRTWDGQERNDPRAPYPAFRVIGGPLAQTGQPVPGVLVQGGNTGRWDVRDGGKLVVRDCWYESNWAPFHMRLRGTGRFTLDCAFDAQYTHPNLKGAGVSYAFDGWRGRFTSLCVGGHASADNPLLAFAGDCTGARLLFLGSTNEPGMAPPQGAAGATLIDLNRRAGPAWAPNPRDLPADVMRDLLTDAREMRIQPLTATPDGVTDLRLSRIFTWNGAVGLHLRGAP